MTDLIGVSCGHRVPRIPIVQEGRGRGGRRLQRRNVYWCETCQQHRMSGGRSTGQHGNAFLHAIPELIDELGPIEFVFPTEPEPHVRRLMATLGVAIVIDGNPQAPYVRRTA